MENLMLGLEIRRYCCEKKSFMSTWSFKDLYVMRLHYIHCINMKRIEVCEKIEKTQNGVKQDRKDW